MPGVDCHECGSCHIHPMVNIRVDIQGFECQKEISTDNKDESKPANNLVMFVSKCHMLSVIFIDLLSQIFLNKSHS